PVVGQSRQDRFLALVSPPWLLPLGGEDVLLLQVSHDLLATSREFIDTSLSPLPVDPETIRLDNRLASLDLLLSHRVLVQRTQLQQLPGDVTRSAAVTDQVLPIPGIVDRDLPEPILDPLLLGKTGVAKLKSELLEAVRLPGNPELMRLLVEREPGLHLVGLPSESRLTLPARALVRGRFPQARLCPGVVHPTLHCEFERNIRLDPEYRREVERVDVVTHDGLGTENLLPHLDQVRGQRNLVLTHPAVSAQPHELVGRCRVEEVRIKRLDVEYQGSLWHCTSL